MTNKILWIGAMMSHSLLLRAQLPDITGSLPKIVHDSNQIIQCRVKSISKPNLSVFINQQRIKVPIPEATYSDTYYYFSVPVTIPPSAKPVQIQIMASSAEGGSSILLSSQLQQPMDVHILSVGIKSGLLFTLKDANDFSEIFKHQNNNNVYRNVLQDSVKMTTTSTILGKLNSLKNAYKTGRITDNDLIILYFSSHGDRQDSTFFIKPSDYQAGMLETSITGAKIQEYLGTDVKCKKILFMDVCRSGSIGEKLDEQPLIQAYKKLQEGLSGWVIFSSSDENESYESYQLENGLFTYALKEALSGGLADKNNNNLISIQELYEYLKNRVPILCSKLPNFQKKLQEPQLINSTLPPTMSIFQLKK